MSPEILALAREAKARAAEIERMRAARQTAEDIERDRIARLKAKRDAASLYTGGDAIALPTQVTQIRRGCVGVQCSHFLNDHQH